MRYLIGFGNKKLYIADRQILDLTLEVVVERNMREF